MKILVDADACPMKNEILDLAQKARIKVVMIASMAVELPQNDNCEIVIVDQEKDAADFAIVNRTEENDIVITDDYGLAALVIEKVKVISTKGHIYKKEDMLGKLTMRHIGQKIRRAGGKTKGPKKYSIEDKNRFIKNLSRILGLSHFR